MRTLLTLSLLVISSVSFANEDGNKAVKNSKIPLVPSVWESAEINAPEDLNFLKAKSALVPIAEFVWGNPEDAPEGLLVVPVAPFVAGDSDENVPEELAFIKANSRSVPVAPFVSGNPDAEPPAGLSLR